MNMFKGVDFRDLSFGKRLAIALMAVWGVVVLFYCGVGAFSNDSGPNILANSLGALLIGLPVWWLPSALLWFVVGGYQREEHDS